MTRTTVGRSARLRSRRSSSKVIGPRASRSKTRKCATAAVSSSVPWLPRKASKIEVGSSIGETIGG